jgi:4-amino-4-deoxy-L-arabinose transferase-like glycosyltransferase
MAMALLAALSLALFLPGIGSFGLWDPYEVHVADAARQALADSHPHTVAPPLGRPPALVWLIAAGFRHLGISELGGRMPIAFMSLVAVLACFYAGSGLIRGRGALIGSFVLATVPSFLLGARQLTSNAPLLAATALAVGGLARAAWPKPGSPPLRRVLDLLLGAAGLALGQLSGGVLVGVVAPLAAVTVGLLAAGGPAGAILAGSTSCVALLVAAVSVWLHPSGYSPLLGGVPRPFANSVVFTNGLKQLGFGLFPWIALLPIATMHALESTVRDGEDGDARDWFGRVTLLAWLGALYCMATLQAAGVQELLIPAAPAVLLLVGGYLDDLLDTPAIQPFAALAATLGAIVLGRDFFNSPEQYVGTHMLETIRWPGPLQHVPYALMAYGAFWGGAIGLCLGAPMAPSTAPGRQLRARRILFGGAVAASLAMALATAHWIVPQCSKHLSARDLYGKSKQLDANAPVGQYRFNASSASYYAGGRAPAPLAALEDLFKFLGRAERVFVMAGAEELPSIDQFARQRQLSFVVVDDSNSRYLMLSNRLGPKERDLNPLRLFVSERAPTPAHPIDVNFDNKIQLLGWDLPAQVSRGQDFKLTLYFKVLAPIPTSYRVFAHIDGPGARINGDHVPLEGRFQTQYWVPGFYITDEHVIHPDKAMQPAGYYQAWVGLFLGAERMKVLSGPQDGEQRVKLGAMLVK